MSGPVGGDFSARPGWRAAAKRVAREALLTPLQRYLVGPIKLRRNRGRALRFLEIGPGPARIDGFETLNVTGGWQVDYIGDATATLPFPDAIFDLVYASHVLEHVAWYRTVDVLREWVRVIKAGGALEVWVPDGLKIASAFVAAERTGSQDYRDDGWWRFNDDHDPCRWMAGRVFSYGDGTGARDHVNWHRALFSERYLIRALHEAGLVDVRALRREEIRGFDHGWINLGATGRKPH